MDCLTKISKKIESMPDDEYENLPESIKDEYHEIRSRLYDKRQRMKLTESDFKQLAKDEWNQLDFTMLDVDATEIESDPHEFAFNVINQMHDKFDGIYNNTWYPVMLGDERAKMLASTNQSNTLKLVNFKGMMIEITRRSVKHGRIFDSEYDRFKFIRIALDKDIPLYKDELE